VSSSWSYLDPVVLPLLVGETVLDAGCGLGRWGALIETNYWEARLPQPPAVDGFDAFEPNVRRCRERGTYRRVWRQEMPSPLTGSWDTVLVCEMIEHVEQSDIDAVLGALEEVALRRIIVTTPNSPLMREGCDTPVGHNAFEAHKSYVPAATFRRRGYRIRGAGFGRYNSRLAIAAKRAGVRSSLTSVPRRLPAIAETLVAIKDVASR
jgi:2-polyprenyl-3-methyl-5-hydroxy-6-metoxy-1,4-benzoquinol methylase